MQGINVGENTFFYGKPFVHRHNNSSITIGNMCRFRSKVRMTNQAGITRPCSIETLNTYSRITIGDGCGFSGTIISAALDISIGNNVMCGANSSITDTDWHGIAPDKRSFKYAKTKRVIIEDNVWLGMNAVVLKGSHIGKNSIIAANSVVVGVIPQNVIAGGNPAKVIKDIF